MFDVFYSGKKPGRFVHELEADSIEHAQKLSSTRYFWWIHYLADLDTWDWLFEPVPWQTDQRHAWPSQHQSDSGVYLVPRAGYTHTNYQVGPILITLPSTEYWHKFEPIAEDKFDWSWHPDPADPPFKYVWGNQWHTPEFKASVAYIVSGATQVKYMDQRTQRLPQPQLFGHNLAVSKFDYSWEPNPFDPPMTYVFGNQWNTAVLEPTVVYTTGSPEIKYVDDIKATVAASVVDFELLDDVENFDYSWRPDPTDPPYIYVFGNQWLTSQQHSALQYRVHGATELKYMDYPKAQRRGNRENFQSHDPCDFDWSWMPDPGDPPYVYVFGNQWWPAEKWPTVEYHVSGATERKYIEFPRAVLHSVTTGWRALTDHRHAIDSTWQPDPGDPPYVYVFGNQWHSAEVMPTVEWRHSDCTEFTKTKYIDWPRAVLDCDPALWHVPSDIDPASVDMSWCPEPGAPAYIYQFGTQHQPTGGPQYSMPGATEVKYVDQPRAVKTSIDPHWVVPAEAATDSFDWTWHPAATDEAFIYQFGTQHQRTGGPQYSMPGATEVKYVEHVKIKIDSGSVPVIEIDHLDGAAGKIPNTLKRIRYFDNYRDTLIRLAKSLVGEHEFVWVCSSICNYSDFDFSWHPEHWQQTMLHVFASDNQKFGDTFYMHVPTFAVRAEKKALLEWYTVNFVKTSVPRRPMPVIVHDGDSQVDAVKITEWSGPLATFTSHVNVPGNVVTVPLWREQTKTIVPVSDGAGTVVVPRVAVPYIKTQLYDYAHIDRTQVRLVDPPLDIVFISNGEINAGIHFEHLKVTIGHDHKNSIHHVSGINGRVAAYHEAARQSTTPWFFAVFAKLQVTRDFDWYWQPDRMQQAKHYIFHAHNPVNGLVYGHQAMIAYNKKLVLDNPGVGLDFTLDSPHEVVPIVSGTAMYHESDWICWRTAFREVLKLRDSLPDVENEHRLNRWLTVDTTSGEWSRKGAEDGIEYYNKVSGDFTALKKSYEWSWLATYAFVKRSLTTDQ